MKTKILIKLDPDPASWGTDCDEATAERANAHLAARLRADGYDVEMHTLAATQISADTENGRDDARRAIERHFVASLDAALKLQNPPEL